MTVTFIEEIPEGRRATNDRGKRTYQRQFKLKTSANSEGPYAVGSHASLPIIGSTYPDDAGAWCTTLDVMQFDGRWGWIVTANYSTERELATDPTNDPALISWNSEQFQRPAVFDTAGNAICNSAGDPFDPPMMLDDSRRVVTIEKNLSVVPSWILTYQDAVNNGSFIVDNITIGTGLAKMQSVSVGPRQERNGIPFRTVHLTMHLEKNGWLLEPLDAGFRETVSGVLENIRNAGDDELPGAPVPLNGAGMSLPNPSYTNNVFLSFTVYATKDFSILPLT